MITEKNLKKEEQIYYAAPPAANSGNKVIALTFDDGPGPYTAQLLDILDQHGAKATFFLIGSKVSRTTDRKSVV